MKTKKNINQADIADRSGLTRSMISQILSGKKRLGKKSIAGLSRALKINPVVFLNATDEEVICIIKSKLPSESTDCP